MARMMKRRTRSVRFFATWLTIALVVAIVAPGSVVLADDGGQTADVGVAEKVIDEGAVDGEEKAAPEPEAPVDAAPPAEEPPADAPDDTVEPVLVEASAESAPVTAQGETASLGAGGSPPTDPGGNPPLCDPGVRIEGASATEPGGPTDVESGTYTASSSRTHASPSAPADYEITITVHNSESTGPWFDWVSNYPVMKVVVKGGNDFATYLYDPAAYSGTGLHAPTNPANEKWYGLSHIDFCFGECEEPETGSITAWKWEDLNGDGVWQSDEEPFEPPIAGWSMTIKDGEDDVASGLTDADGKVVFSGLDLETEYTVVEGSDTDFYPTTPATQSVYAQSDGVDVFFGNAEYAMIVVTKFHDLNGDGVWQSDEEPFEPPLEGWEYELYDAEESLLATGTTDVVGELVFAGLEVGSYSVTEVVKPGWALTTPNDVDVTLMSGETADVLFGNGEVLYVKTFEFTYPDKPAGVDLKVTFDLNGEPESLWLTGEGPVYSAEIDVPYPYEIANVVWWADGPDGLVALGETPGETLEGDLTNEFEYDPSLSGHKFNDYSEDGIWDGDEPPIEGWTIFLYRVIPQDVELYAVPPLIPGLEFVASTLTDENGYYEFSGMLPGLYVLKEDLPVGWTQSVAPEGPFLVEHGTALEDLDFGNYEPFVPFTELDLAILKEASADEADPGDTVDYTLTYWNNGELPATDFTITDDFDERYVEEVFDVSDGGVVDMVNGTITWDLAGPLAMEDGEKTLTYSVRLIEDMPEDETNVDNVVVIEHPRDTDPSNNTDDWRVVVDNPALPFTEEEPFLPFTGGSLAMLIGAALASAGIGVALRRRRRDA